MKKMNGASGKLCHVRLQKLPPAVQKDEISRIFHQLFPSCNARIYPFQWTEGKNLKQAAVSFILRNGESLETAIQTLNEARPCYGLPGEEKQFELVVEDARGNGISLVAESHQNPAFDCYFIHGLHGHPFATFIRGDKLPPHGQPIFWPADWLPEKAESHGRLGRYFVFGYNSSFNRGNNFCPGVETIGKSLLESIKSTRKPGIDRPIFLIGHSLGGLVACQAVVLAMDSDESALWYPYLHSADGTFLVKGISFFGTPFKGSIIATILAPVIGMIPFIGLSNNQMIQLRQEDKRMKAMLLHFEELRKKNLDPLFPLFIFWEETKVVHNILSGRILLGHQIVKRECAEGYFDKNDETIKRKSLRRDHRTMVKYTKEEKHLFEEFANPLFQCMMRSVDRGSGHSNPPFLRGRIDRRAPPTGPSIRTGIQRQFSTGPILDFQIPDLAVIDGTEPIGESHSARANRSPSDARKSSDKTETAISWFDIGDRSAFFMKPELPLPGSCDWIHEKVLFQNWLNSPNDTVLFITGPVGRGKSVLAGYITNHVAKGYSSPSSIVVPFYCRAGLGSFNPAAVLKHILFRIYQTFPVESDRVITAFAEFRGIRATFSSLWTLFIALRRTISFKLFAIIDGIDEIIRKEWAPEESRKLKIMGDFLINLCKELSTDGAMATAKILFISQPLAAIDHINTEFPGKVLPIDHADITPNVKKLVEARLREFFKGRPLTTEQINDLMDLVKNQSGSMFLYADRIIKQIRKRVESHDAFRFYESLIKSYVPGNTPDTEYLDEIYGATLREILETSDLSQASKMNVTFALRILFAAEKDLGSGILSHLVGFARVRHQYGDETINMSDSPKIYLDAIPRAQDLVQELRHRCGNLVTVADESVCFSHDTVRSYLARLDSPELNDFYFRNEGDGNHLMACLCLDFLIAGGTNEDLQKREDDPNRRSHYLATQNFVFQNWSKYLKNVSEEDLIRLWPAVCAVFEERGSINFRSQENLRIPPSFFLVSNNMRNILRLAQLEIDGKKVFGLGKPRLPRLGKLIVPWTKRVHPQLSELKIDLDARDGKGNTVLHHAAIYGSTELDFLLPYAAQLRKVHPSLKNKDGETPFWKAMSRFDESVVWRMIQANETERESKSRQRWSSFQLAVANHSPRLVTWFLDNGSSIDDGEGKFGRTALMIAVINEKSAVVRLLLERGPDIMRQDEDGRTAFTFAAETGNVDILGQLLDTCSATAQIPVDRWGWGPIFYAARDGHLALFEMLHSRFPNLASNRTGQLPVHVAAENGQMAILKSPIVAQSLGMQDNFRWTPLHFAAMSKSLDAVKYCFPYSDKDSRALDPNASKFMSENQQYCHTPLSIALTYGNETSAMFLLNQNALSNIILSNGDTLLHRSALSGLLEVCRFLLESEGFNPIARNNYGQIPMHLAAAGGHINVFEYLHCFCSPRAIPEYSIDLLDDDGCTAVFYAIEASATSVFDFICKATTPNFELTNCYQRTYLMAAASQKDVQLFQKVFQKTASQINNTSLEGWTALHFAAKLGDLEIVDTLLKNGANLMIEDITGDIPLTIATAYLKVAVAHRLDSQGSNVLHIDKIGRPILSLIDKSSPLWEREMETVTLKDYFHVSEDIRWQWIRNIIQQHFAKFSKQNFMPRILPRSIWEMLRQLEGKSIDSEIKVLSETGAIRLANGSRLFPTSCFSCEATSSTSSAHVCRNCWRFRLLCDSCFGQRSIGKTMEGCPPTHEYMEILDDVWFELEDGIVNEEGDCLDCFMGKIQEKYCAVPAGR